MMNAALLLGQWLWKNLLITIISLKSKWLPLIWKSLLLSPWNAQSDEWKINKSSCDKPERWPLACRHVQPLLPPKAEAYWEAELMAGSHLRVGCRENKCVISSVPVPLTMKKDPNFCSIFANICRDNPVILKYWWEYYTGNRCRKFLVKSRFYCGPGWLNVCSSRPLMSAL